MYGVPADDGGPAHGADADGGGRRQEAPRAAGDRVALAAFVARLRQAGLDPDARQVCDAIWLAGHLTPDAWAGRRSGSPQDRATDGTREGENGVGGVTGSAGDGNTAPVDATPQDQNRPPTDPRIALGAPRPVSGDGSRGPGRGPGPYGAGRGAGGGAASAGGALLPVGVPLANALPGTLQLQRALRPLQRYRRPNAPVETTLDEAATADLSARAGGLVVPVYRASARAEVDLQLVMDVSSSMLVWQRLVIELEDIFSHLGAFRDVRVRYLHQGPDGEPGVSTSLDPRGAALGPAERLSDPTGSRITVLLSDCAGPLWYSGQAHRLLYRLSKQAPVAVLQPLPQRLWGRTGLPVTYGVLARGEGSGSGALRLVGRSAPARAAGAVAVPVLPPVAASLGAWAGLLSGAGAGHTDGAVGWVRSDQPATAAPRGGQPLHAAQVVRRFRSAASRDAGRLAGYLAAAPLWMPVMQLVQRTMLPDSGPAELAEVLLGGLMRRDKNAPAEGGPWYAFEPGVQDELLAPLTREEALLVLKHCSDYIERHFGKGSWNFPAVAAAQLDRGRSGIDWPVPHHGGTAGQMFLEGEEDAEEARRARSAVPHPFAEVAAHVLEQFMAPPAPFPPEREEAHRPPDAVRSAWSLVRDYEADGMMQHLVDAVQLLRGAVANDERAGAAVLEEADGEEGRTEVRTTLATCLLRLWEVQGGAALLQEAEEAARWAIERSGGVHGRAVLAGILHAAADDRLRRGDERGALQLLQRADREYAAACSAPGMAPGDALRLTLERVRALESEWRLGHDSALLQSAVGTLEAFSDAWPDQRNRPAALPLALGRMLLRLSGATEDAEQAQLYAKQAARSLRTALGEQNGARQTGGTQAGTVLDLADALLASGDGLDDGLTLVGRALGIVRDERLSAQLRLREGRLRLARYEAGAGATPAGDPAELYEAVRSFELAARGVPRDTAAHADVLAEWGGALLRRAGLPQEQEQVHAAVHVLRDCRAETSPDDPDQAERLLMLGRALMIRHRIAEDRVDLREAEYLFGLAAREAGDPLTEARCWLELGNARFDAHRVLHRPTRLDEAADAFRDAAEAARRAEEGANDSLPALTARSEEAVALQARAHHGRGRTYAEAARPRAAREAYRAAREQWRKLPGGGGEEAQETLDRLAELEM